MAVSGPAAVFVQTLTAAKTSPMPRSFRGPIVKDKVGISLAAEYIRDDDTPDPDETHLTELEEKEISTVAARLTFTPTDHQTLEANITLTNDDRWRETVSGGTTYEDIYELDKAVIGLGWQGNPRAHSFHRERLSIRNR